MLFSESSEELAALEHKRCAYLVQGNLDGLDSLFSEYLIYTHGSGVRDGKAGFLEKLRTGQFVFLRWDVVVEDAELVGETGYVVGHHSAEVSVAGVTKHLRNHFLSVWHRTASGWQCCAYQPTPMQKVA